MVDSALFVNSARMVARHQRPLWIPFRMFRAATYLIPQVGQFRERHVHADAVFVLELGRNGRPKLDRAVVSSFGEQFVQGAGKLFNLKR